MNEHVVPHFILPSEPSDFPGLVAFWNFTESGDSFRACQGEPYILNSQSGTLAAIDSDTAPFGGKALHLEEGQWLNCARSECPKLDIHGPSGHLTVLAWIRRARKSNTECEFIAGQWNESNKGRQYGLFLNIGVWQQADQVCGHLSNVGGPTPGFKYCIDGPVGSKPVPRDEWSVVGMSYDGQCGYAWLNGQLDTREGLNPYSMAGGLHNGGPNGSDFTVGAVDRHSNIGNFFTGDIAALAVYDRALSPAEIYALSSK
ncbi:LamG-like jellyroll fold domain-containing protein [Coraliomargarita parva]|uniref:LamG-like jellyroll fold domain-containing protein n=1 Tax=Coraliomargarita parva TaxID=3014050 RepID=UPI0022B2FB8E|nr:LamG-like jellyroll fold domain-containing protein [Coraliomargarita parva]